jgi:phosphoribosylaminoimidazolecarboxamide formyltransferase/IMP cyclohydrolase
MSINTVREIDDLVAVKTVLVSVADKTGLESLVEGLLSASPRCKILSTGGTHTEIARILGPRAADRLSQVSVYTGQSEMQGGLVKTLDYKIYLGLLSESYNPAHREDLRRFGASEIDMVVSSLYPFQQTVSRADCSAEWARGNIDIGGPCMVRAAAKNFHRVAAVTDPADYGEVVSELRLRGGSLCLATRFRLAQKAFGLIAGYDEAISRYLAGLSFETMSACYAIKNKAH